MENFTDIDSSHLHLSKDDQELKDLREHLEEYPDAYRTMFKNCSEFTPHISGDYWFKTYEQSTKGDFVSMVVLSKLWGFLPDELNPQKRFHELEEDDAE